MTVVPFPTRTLIERDIRGALFRNAMAFVAELADYLDRSPEAHQFKRENAAFRLESMRLTCRMLAASSVLFVARAWLGSEIEDAEASQRLDCQHVRPLLPFEADLGRLNNLVIEANTFLERIARLKRHLEAELCKAA